MRKVSKEVKSQKKLLSTIEVDQFDTIKEASDKLGAERVLGMINKVFADAAVNSERTAKTRTASPISRLARLAKGDEKVAKRIEELIAQAEKEAAR